MCPASVRPYCDGRLIRSAADYDQQRGSPRRHRVASNAGGCAHTSTTRLRLAGSIGRGDTNIVGLARHGDSPRLASTRLPLSLVGNRDWKLDKACEALQARKIHWIGRELLLRCTLRRPSRSLLRCLEESCCWNNPARG